MMTVIQTGCGAFPIKFNLLIVILQYVFRQHNNIRINVLLPHVSTQESHRQADYLRTVNTLYHLQSRVKPSTPARRMVHYKRDRSPTRPTTAPRDPTTTPRKPEEII